MDLASGVNAKLVYRISWSPSEVDLLIRGRSAFRYLQRTSRLPLWYSVFKMLFAGFLCELTLVSTLTSIANAATLQRRAAIDDCLKSASVPVDVSGSSDWKADILPFNARLSYTPAAVAVPTTIPQIQAAVNCARTSGLKATAKGGGHSYASLGLGGEDGHLMIELDRMFNVTLNKTSNIAVVQPGARLGHVATQLFNQGGRAISAGTCPGYASSNPIIDTR